MLHHYDPINNSLTLLSCLFGLLWLKFCQYIMLFPWFFLCQNEIHFIALPLVAGGCLWLKAVRNLSSCSCREQSVCSSLWSSMGTSQGCPTPRDVQSCALPLAATDHCWKLISSGLFCLRFQTQILQYFPGLLKLVLFGNYVFCLPLVPSDCLWRYREIHVLCWLLLWQIANNIAFLFGF